MKLRHRLAIAFTLASSTSVVAARLVTLESFRRVQQYELDEGLRERARREGNEVALVGRKALEEEYAAQGEGETNPLEYLVTYGALYRSDGTVVADTPSFAHAPPLRELGIDLAAAKPPTAPFDFRFRDTVLRGVLVEIRSPSPPERQYLLLAASRRDMDADAQLLLAVGWWVTLAWLPVTLAVGWWLGRRMTLGIEGLAGAARHVTAGDLHLPLSPRAAADDEVAVLGRALQDMVARLESLIQRERRFASHAAHELRSPLAALRGELELALRRRRTTEEYEAALGDALDDTNRLIDLSEDLLVLARLGSAAAEAREDVAAGELADEAVATSMGAARGEVVTIVRDEGDLTVRGSRSALVRMLRNLVDNAIAHGGGAPARLRVTREEEPASAPGASAGREGTGEPRVWVAFVVEDDGPGVAEADRDRIFEHFHRGADARQESGAGLGLGIAREVARQHGGDVVLASPARPTRFVVRLPATSPAPPARGSAGGVVLDNVVAARKER